MIDCEPPSIAVVPLVSVAEYVPVTVPVAITSVPWNWGVKVAIAPTVDEPAAAGPAQAPPLVVVV